ncbi:polysaccharide deacetylase family protein [Enterococcus olivae]
MTTYAKRSQRHHRKSPNYLVWTVTILFILLLVGGGSYSIYGLIEEKKLQEKIDEAADQLIQQIENEQQNSDLSSEKQEQSTGRITSILYFPEQGQEIPFDVSHETFNDLLKEEKKKLDHPRKAILIGQVANESLSEHLGAYTLKVDTYLWQSEKEDFEKERETLDQATYYLTETGDSVTAQDLIGSEADLLGIQQVIQQKILDQSEEPDKIIDSVLDLPRISLDTTMTYMPDQLKVELPENETGTTELLLPYEDIRPFIQKDLVDPRYLEEASSPLEEDKKYVALTFDDGPNPATTPELLTILEQKEVHATFFMLGQNVENYPEIVKDIHDGGHVLASHSYSHPQLNAIGEDELKEEIRKTDKAIFDASGILPKTLRPPYGAIGPESAKIIGKPIIQWDIDSYDWQSKDKDATIQRINDTVVPGGIILMHDIHPSTIAAVADVIDNLHEQGYEIVTIEDLLAHKEKPLYQYFGQDDAREI